MKIYSSDEYPALGITGQYWKIVAANVTGARHERDQKSGQDVFACGLHGEWITAAICDGAGSAVLGLSGARFCTHAIVNELLNYIEESGAELILTESDLTPRLLRALNLARSQVQELGELRAFAATLIGVLAGKEGGIFFQIGDGVGVAVSHIANEIAWNAALIAVPEYSEYVNETYFFTDPDYLDHLRLRGFGAVKSIFLMSDGVRPYALDAHCLAVEERFMTPLVRYLITEPSAPGAQVLAKTLGSPEVRKISDDDQTLIYLTRVDCENELNDLLQ